MSGRNGLFHCMSGCEESLANVVHGIPSKELDDSLVPVNSIVNGMSDNHQCGRISQSVRRSLQTLRRVTINHRPLVSHKSLSSNSDARHRDIWHLGNVVSRETSEGFSSRSASQHDHKCWSVPKHDVVATLSPVSTLSNGKLPRR